MAALNTLSEAVKTGDEKEGREMKRVTEDELKALKHNTALVEKYDRAMIQVRTALINQEKW